MPSARSFVQVGGVPCAPVQLQPLPLVRHEPTTAPGSSLVRRSPAAGPAPTFITSTDSNAGSPGSTVIDPVTFGSSSGLPSPPTTVVVARAKLPFFSLLPG